MELLKRMVVAVPRADLRYRGRVKMYLAKEDRYEHMNYFRCGNSGLKCLRFLWGCGTISEARTIMTIWKQLVFTAFDNGITHFDLANNYGPVYGSAEENFRKDHGK